MANMFRSALLVAMSATALSASAADDGALVSEKDKTSNAVGVQTIRSLKTDSSDIDLNRVIQGMRDGASTQRPLLSDKEVKQRMQALMATIRQNAVANRQEAATKNRIKGDEFLVSNKQKQGVHELSSGVQYRVLKAGSGSKAGDAGEIVCNYRGTLINGTEFDASPADHPVHLKMAQVIPGWRDAVKNMPLGSRWEVAIPSALAYGERGVGTDIGPNEVLVFDIDLVDVK